MTTGRVVTEHDVLPDLVSRRWSDSHLHRRRVGPGRPCSSRRISASTSRPRGWRSTGLLDAVVTFHDELPTVGQVIRYDIAIDGFFRQGESRLFRFRFEATVDGRPLMSMSQGCAGFFTSEALAAGQGVVKTALDLREIPGVRPDDWSPLVPMAVESLDDDFSGRGAPAWGSGRRVRPAFEGLNLPSPPLARAV